MSQQDKASDQDKTPDIVVNHQTIKQVVDWLLPPALFAGMRTTKKKKKMQRKPSGKKRSRGKKRSGSNRRPKNKTQSAESIEKKANSPQIWLTLLWHMGTGLPWAWKTGSAEPYRKFQIALKYVYCSH